MPRDLLLAKPKSWDTFEDIACDLFTEFYKGHNFQRYGRQGQGQNGVDIVGVVQDEVVGIQCKHSAVDDKLTSKQLDDEIKKADEFSPTLNKLIFATSASRDTTLTTHCLNTSIKRKYNSVDAYSTFSNHIDVPFPTLDFIKGLYSSVSKIFQADNPFINYVFSDKEKKAENLDFYKKDCWEAYKDTPNAIVIIDTNGNNYERYILDIRFVEYVKSEGNIIKEIIFSFDNKTYYAFDNESLLVAEKETGADYSTLTETKNEKNKVGKTPAVWLSNKFISGTNEIVRQSLISDSLTKIEELLITEINDVIINEKLVPVTLKYIDKCTYDVGHEYCLDGWIMKRVEESSGDTIITNDVSKIDYNNKRVPCYICNQQLVPGDTVNIEKPVE